MAKIIDGKAISNKIKERVKQEVNLLKEKNIFPGLAVIIVGNDPASRVYVNNKKKACEFVGIYSREYALPDNISQSELIDLIRNLNKDRNIDGILVQLPLPKHIDEKAVIKAIDPIKDVDAFHSENVGKVMIGDYYFAPCTPAGIIEILKEENIDICGKNCVVIGRSNIVGKPMAMLLLHNNATVTICHSKTKNISEVCKSADIIVVAVGVEKFLTKGMVKPGAVIIDVGMNRDLNGNLCGDVDFENVSKIASHITPVPGGVGPMTIAMLMENTVKAAKIQRS